MLNAAAFKTTTNEKLKAIIDFVGDTLKMSEDGFVRGEMHDDYGVIVENKKVLILYIVYPYETTIYVKTKNAWGINYDLQDKYAKKVHKILEVMKNA